jgi:hypothetical protein
VVVQAVVVVKTAQVQELRVLVIHQAHLPMGVMVLLPWHIKDLMVALAAVTCLVVVVERVLLVLLVLGLVQVVTVAMGKLQLLLAHQ